MKTKEGKTRFKKTIPIDQRLISGSTRTPETNCLEWTRARSTNGYGIISWRDNIHYAHRLAFEIFRNQEISSGSYVLHTCDNRQCIEPTHLFLGTARDNTQDMINKGREDFWGWKNGRK